MSTSAFAGSIPDNYDRYLRPLLFEPYATDLVARLELRPAMRVLEIACGTGIVTRQLLARVPGDAAIVATDLSEPMLAIAQQRVSPDLRLAWQPADALSLPFDPGAFDAVVCQFGVMFFPDKARGFAEMRRVLKPGGQLLVNVWDAFERNPISRLAHEALAQAFPQNPPTFLTIPFGFHDQKELQRMVSAAGFSAVKVEPVEAESHSPSALDAATGLVTGSPMALELREAGASLTDALEAVTRALTSQYGSGAIAARMSAIVVDARA